MAMRLANYDEAWGLPRPDPGWQGVRRRPRAAIEPSLTSVVAQVMPGHPGDEVVTLVWKTMLANPAVHLLGANGDVATDCDDVETGDRIAIRLPATTHRGISAVRLVLQASAPVAGYLTMELWSGIPGALSVKIGTIGHIHANKIYTLGHDIICVWADAAYGHNLLDHVSEDVWLVLCAENMTGAGHIHWAGLNTGGAGTAYYKYTSGGGWNHYHGDFCYAAWAGAPLPQIRGLVGSYGGGQSVEVELDDGQVYTGVLLDCEWDKTVEPFAFASPGAFDIPVSPAVAENVSLTLGITDELA